MNRREVLDAIAELGQEFARLGWSTRLPRLREYFAAVAAGRDSTERWTLQHLRRMQQVMQLGPEPLPVATRCPVCPPPPDGMWSGTRTGLHLEDRWTCRCADCGAEWVALTTG